MALFHTTVLDNQIKALPTVSTASGSIATFNTDLTENLVKCVCEVASGSSEINVSACGINLWDEQTESGTYNWTTGEETPNTNFFRTANYIKVLPSTNYTLVNPTKTTTYLRVAYYNKNGAFISATSYLNGTITLTTPNTCDYVKFAIAINFYGSTYANDISFNSSTDTQYHAYNGNTYNIPFGETLSGDGSFDILSGILTRSDDTTSQLSANYIQTNNGINNIWCDTGDTEVKYLLTVGKKIA